MLPAFLVTFLGVISGLAGLIPLVSESSLLVVSFPLETFLLFFGNHRVKVSLNGDFLLYYLSKIAKIWFKKIGGRIFHKE